MVIIKLAIVLFVIGVGAIFYIDTANWHPFAPYGYTGLSFFGNTYSARRPRAASLSGMLAGAAIIFFAYIGFDSVSTHSEEAKNPQRDVPIGIIARSSSARPLHRRLGGADGHGALQGDRHQRAGRRGLQARGLTLGSTSIAAGAMRASPPCSW
jgi:hypothetical protein